MMEDDLQRKTAHGEMLRLRSAIYRLVFLVTYYCISLYCKKLAIVLHCIPSNILLVTCYCIVNNLLVTCYVAEESQSE